MTLHKLDDIDTMSETVTYMIQESASRVAKAINKPPELRSPDDDTTGPDDDTTRNGGKLR